MKDEIKAFFSREHQFLKILAWDPEFEYPPLCERSFGFREISNLTGTKMRVFSSGHAPVPPYNSRAFGTPQIDL